MHADCKLYQNTTQQHTRLATVLHTKASPHLSARSEGSQVFVFHPETIGILSQEPYTRLLVFPMAYSAYTCSQYAWIVIKFYVSVTYDRT